MSAPPRKRGFRDWGTVLLAVLGGYVLLYRLWSFFSTLPLEERGFWSTLAVLPLIVVFVLALRAAHTPGLDPQSRKAWACLAISFLLSWLGDALWILHRLVLSLDAFVVLQHLFYALSYPAMLIGLLSFPGFLRTRGQALQFGLDATIVLLGGLMLFWSIIYSPAATVAGPDFLSLPRAVGYSLGDLLMLLTGSMIAARHWREPIRPVFLLLLVGLLVNLVNDSSYGLQVLKGEESIALADLSLFMFGGFAFAASAYAQRRLALAYGPDLIGGGSPKWAMSLLPYLGAATGYATLFVAVLQGHTESLRGLVIGAVLLTAAVLLRQAVAIRENLGLVTERVARESETALRKSEQATADRTAQLDALLTNSPMAIVAMDPEMRIQFVNPAFEQIFQYGKDEAQGQLLPTLLVPEDPALVAESDGFRREALAGGTLRATSVRRRKDGTLVDVEIHGMPMISGGRRLGYYAIYTDVTEQTQLAGRLRQAQKMEAVGQLAGGVAHDFNNILTAILGYSDLLIGATPSEDPRHEDLQEIRRAAVRAAALTSQLLAFSRRQLLSPRVLDLGALVGPLGNMLRRLIGENIELNIRVAPDVGSIKADPGQIEQVVLNLAVNAREAMPGGGRLWVVVESAVVVSGEGTDRHYVEPGSYVALVVRDTGIGMDSHVRAHLFEPFFTTKETGTGLGLATVYGIVKQSGGYIWADSEPGRGSTLTLYFPKVDEKPEVAKAEVTVPRERGTETILLVEDEKPLRRLAHRILSGLGYTVMDVESAEHALDVFRDHGGEIHLVLTDVVLPGLSGWELAGLLSTERPSMRVIFMSGYTDGQIPAAATSDPSWKLIQKPFSSAQLAREVRSALDRASA